MRLFVFVLALTMPTVAFGQSLGEVARKEKERRKQSEQATKAKEYSEQDVKKLPPVQTPGSTAVNPASVPPARIRPDRESPADSSEARRADEARWRQRAAHARTRVAKAREQVAYLESLSLTPGEAYVDQQGRPVFTSPEQIQRAVADARKELASAEEALSRLEDEARRSNVPPGWLRE